MRASFSAAHVGAPAVGGFGGDAVSVGCGDGIEGGGAALSPLLSKIFRKRFLDESPMKTLIIKR